MTRTISETVQRLPYIEGTEDAHGNPVKTWAEPVDVSIFAFDPGATAEPRVAGHDRVTVEPTIYGPYEMPFQPEDKCIARGETYQVEGVTRNWMHPNGNAPGSVVTLRKVTG